MSRGRKALLFIGIGLLAFILPWFIWADLLASGLALALAFLVGPVLFLIGGVLGTIGVVKGDEHPVEAMVAMVLGVLPFVLIIVWFLFNF